MKYKPKVRHVPETRRERDMDRQAHMILSGAPKYFPAIPSEPERKSYRSVGSVVQANGRWRAIDGDGQTIGEFGTRWEAWRTADKLGLEPIDLAFQ